MCLQILSGFFLCQVSLEKVVFRCAQTYVTEKYSSHRLNLLNFVRIVMFDLESALENAKLAILEQIANFFF